MLLESVWETVWEYVSLVQEQWQGTEITGQTSRWDRAELLARLSIHSWDLRSIPGYHRIYITLRFPTCCLRSDMRSRRLITCRTGIQEKKVTGTHFHLNSFSDCWIRAEVKVQL